MKKWSLVFLILIMIFSMIGCSSSSDEPKENNQGTQQDTTTSNPDTKKDTDSKTEDSKPTDSSDDGDTTIVQEDFYSNVLELAKDYQEIEYTMKMEMQGDKRTSKVQYLNLGKEKVDGKDAYKFRFIDMYDNNRSETDVWVAEDGTYLKVKMDGNEFDAQLAEAMFLSHLALLSYDVEYWEEMVQADINEVIAKIGTENKNLGSGNIKVTKYEINWEDGTFTFEVGENKGHKLLLSSKSVAPDEGTVEIVVTKLIAN